MIKKNGGIFGRNPTYNDVVVEGVLTLKEAQVFDNDITINGDLTVNGTETVINTVELNVDDKNITMGAVVAKVGLAATTNITAGQFTVQLADTSGLIPGMTVTKTSGTGAFGVSPKIASVDSHTQITLTVAHATSGTIIFDTGGATDDTADGGGITLKGTTDKFIKWVKANLAWVFSDPIKVPDVTVDNLTASQSVFTDANKKLVSADASTARSNLGLGTMATQASNNVSITGGSISGITDLAVADGGTGASDAATARTNLGLGSIATQAANNVAITGGSINGTTIGGTTAAAGTFTTMRHNSYRKWSLGRSTQANQYLAMYWAGTKVFKGIIRIGISYPWATTAARSYHEFEIDANTAAGGGRIQYLRHDFSASDTTNYQGRVYYDSTTGTLTVAHLSVPNVEQDAEIEIFLTQGSMPDADPAWTTSVPAGTLQAASLEVINGNVTLGTGNLIIGTSGKGIDFSATSQASGMTSELLSDYEEGTWTPTIIGTSTAGTATYGTQTGTYTKIGRTVFFQFELNYNSGNGSGNLRISGLPFTCNASNTAVSIGDIENIALTASYVAGAYVLASSTQIALREFQVGGGGNNPVAYDAAGILRVAGCYNT